MDWIVGVGVLMGMGMDMLIMYNSDCYEFVKDIGLGNFGVVWLMRDKKINEFVVVKCIERGEKVSVFLFFNISDSIVLFFEFLFLCIIVVFFVFWWIDVFWGVYLLYFF